MTQEETLDYNRRCAEFLGWKNKGMINLELWISTENQMGIATSDLQFHSDWNWIMKVVEAIKQLGYFVMINKWTSVYTGREGDRIQITTVERENTKVNTVQAINQFLIWYNKNK